MNTELIVADLFEWKEAAQHAADALLAGQVVAVPTETVYGLAASIHDETALQEIYKAKERPSYDPLIVHIGDLDDLEEVADIDDAIVPVVQDLVDAFWPGPLTLVLPKLDHLSDIITSGLDTVAVRMPSHEIMQEICQLAGPLAAPSANRFGRISPTSAPAVMDELGGRIPLIIDGGACSEGVESTIIRISPPPAEGKKPIFTLLRPGAITREQLRAYGKVEKPKPPRKDATADPAPSAASPIESPGLLESHYAPVTPLYLYDSIEEFQPEPGKKYGLLSVKGEKGRFYDAHDWASEVTLSPGSGKVSEAAVRFYWALRELDKAGLDAIIAEPIQTANVGEALMDRLKKAAVNR